ncbi:MAG TPA: alpha/beta fold hydrolase [Actinomycetota bacterium]|nr:alpha/beta fold hydrolase [Actinomycetota bacterium]
MAAAGTPVVFIHGLWLHADSWGPWVDLFRQSGYQTTAPGWPGEPGTVEQARKQAADVAGYGIQDVVDHYTRIIGNLDGKPIAIGHSFGGLVVQRLLGQDLAVAGVAIDAAPIKGVLNLPLSALRVASIALRNPANKKRAVSLTREQFRYGFGNAISPRESDELYDRWTIPSPGKPLFEAAFAAFSPQSPAKVNTDNTTRGPLLLTAGGKDHTVPAAITRSTRKLYRHSSATTAYKEFPDRGHTLALDSRWREVADAVLAWLREHSL